MCTADGWARFSHAWLQLWGMACDSIACWSKLVHGSWWVEVGAWHLWQHVAAWPHARGQWNMLGVAWTIVEKMIMSWSWAYLCARV
eukprot:6491994-Amphidinium_carterae.2